MPCFHQSVSLLIAGALCGSAMAGELAPRVEAEIVVTAPRMLAPLEVVTDPGKPRQPLPAHDGADYLKTIPGFAVTRKGGTDADPLFRGMAGSRVHILADDGMLLGGCGARMDPPTAYVFPQSYDAIRVLKGPQSVRWGTAAAATVLFERDDFDPTEGAVNAEASVLGASAERRDLAGGIEVGSERGYLRLRGTHARSDDYQDGDGNDIHSAYARWNANAAFGWTPTERTLVELSGALSDGEAAYADRSMDGTRFEREALTLRIRQRGVSEHIDEIEAHLAWGYVDHVMDNYNLRDFVPSMMMPKPSASNPDRETLAGRITASVEVAAALSAVAGIDAHADTHAIRSSMNQSSMPYQSMPRVDDAEFRRQGAFAEITWAFAPGQRWVGGLRLDRWQVEDQRETVRVGMMPMPNATAGATDRDWLASGFARHEHILDWPSSDQPLTTYAGIGYSERVADYWERFGGDKQSPSSNSAFFTDPERTMQLDIGVMGAGERSRWSASLFASRIDDYILIDTRFAGKPSNAVVTRNVDARTWGGELEHVLAFADHWTLESALALTRAENRSDGGALAQMPPIEARIALNWARERVSVGGLLRGVAGQDRVDPGRGNIAGQDIDESSGYAVVSLNGSYRLSRRLNVSMGVDNLFDRNYAEHLSRAGAMVAGFLQSDRVSEPGRTAWLKLDMAL